MKRRYEKWAENTLDVRSFSGDEANVVCPLHEDHNPSMRFNTQSGLWFCHGCHQAGNVQKLAGLLGKEIEEEVTIDLLLRELEELRLPTPEHPWSIYPDVWLDQFYADWDQTLRFWEGERGLSVPTIQEFGLGWDLENDAGVIPLRGPTGALHGIIRRFQSPDKQKYLNPSGFKKGQFLFGSNRVSGTTVALVEGPIDALCCWDAGVPTVAILGSRLSHDQVRILQELGVACVVSMMDDDSAGRSAVVKVDEILDGIMHYVGQYEEDWGSDPGELTSEQIQKMYVDSVPFHQWSGRRRID